MSPLPSKSSTNRRATISLRAKVFRSQLAAAVIVIGLSTLTVGATLMLQRLSTAIGGLERAQTALLDLEIKAAAVSTSCLEAVAFGDHRFFARVDLESLGLQDAFDELMSGEELSAMLGGSPFALLQELRTVVAQLRRDVIGLVAHLRSGDVAAAGTQFRNKMRYRSDRIKRCGVAVNDANG